MTEIQTSNKRYPIRDIFQRFYPQYEAEHPYLPEHKRKVARMIMGCKTGDLGYSRSVCEDCGQVFVHNASCNNRSCPCCQHPQEQRWIAERQTELIEGIAYYHVVFTLPEELNPLIQMNEEALLKSLFHCVNDTLITLCADRRFMGAKPAILCVLHTWGQQLNYHPHVHVCLSGGGLRPDNTFGETSHKHFIIPKPVIASYFRGRFLCSVKKLHDDRDHPLSIPENLKDPDNWKAYIDLLFTKKWLPFVKETFNGNGNAIQYLGRYSYRTAISNSRITSVDEDTVSFRYKDYADGNAPKILTVKGTEFIDLFLRHVLPKGFSRIRYAGILTNSRKTKNLKHIHQLRNTVYQVSPCKDMKVRELVLHLFNRDIEKCSCCGGHLIVIYRNRGRPKNMEPSLPSTPSAAMC